MKYKAYNEINRDDHLLTHFRTKREAVAHAIAIDGDAKMERKIGSN